MYSGAKAPSSKDLGPQEDSEAQRQEAQQRGVQVQRAIHDDLATSNPLPVPQLVESTAPSSPEVQSGNNHSPRVGLGSTIGRHTTTHKNTKALLLPSGKGNATKIFPAHGARGKSLANFESTS